MEPLAWLLRQQCATNPTGNATLLQEVTIDGDSGIQRQQQPRVLHAATVSTPR
jgi:hypothetical protein